jgi:predicted nuclease of predicted toxin-antitoxin system
VKLLFDQNLSPRLVRHLHDLYPDSAHVSQLGLDRAGDVEIWAFAQKDGYTIVSRDTDFNDLATLRGFPPKILWIRRGNCSTNDVEKILREHEIAVRTLLENAKVGLLTLF